MKNIHTSSGKKKGDRRKQQGGYIELTPMRRDPLNDSRPGTLGVLQHVLLIFYEHSIFENQFDVSIFEVLFFYFSIIRFFFFKR